MKVITLYWDTLEAHWVVTQYEGQQVIRQEIVMSTQLSSWLNQQKISAGLTAEQSLTVLVEENHLRRVLVRLPAVAKPKQLRKIAKSYLLSKGEHQACMLSIERVKDEKQEAFYVLTTCDRAWLTQQRQMLGKWFAKCQFVDLTRWQFSSAHIDTGCWMVQEDGQCRVMVVDRGVVIASVQGLRYEQHELLQKLRSHLEQIGFHTSAIQTVQAFDPSLYSLGPENIKSCSLTLEGTNQSIFRKKSWWVLFVGTVVAPLMVLLCLQLYQPTRIQTEQAEATKPTIHRKHYHTLLEKAYQVQGERLVLTQQRAEANTLLLQGRVEDPLDLSDYMKRLEEQGCKVLLLEVQKEQDSRVSDGYVFSLQVKQ